MHQAMNKKSMTDEYQKLLQTVNYDTTQVELGKQFEPSNHSARTSPGWPFGEHQNLRGAA